MRKKNRLCKCGNKILHDRRGNCHQCNAAYARENRTRHRDLTDIQKMKANARSYAGVYKRRGLLKQKPCEICNEKKSEMHHEDYCYPLQVIWLCRECHLLSHEKTKAIEPWADRVFIVERFKEFTLTYKSSKK